MSCRAGQGTEPAVPLEKNGGWCVGKIRRPFLETVKRTDQECQRSWLCCSRREDVVETAPDGRYVQGVDATTAVPVADNASARRGKTDGPRWRGLLALLAACMFSICGSCIMWSTDTFDNFVANQMILDESKGSFEWWVNPPINPWFRVYIWNYTNWDEYLQDPSIKIKLQEVGPFYFKEVIRRENIQFDEKGITLSYREVKTYDFMPDMSGADPNATVRVPSLPFFGAQAEFAKVESSLKSSLSSSLLWEPLKMVINVGGDLSAMQMESYTHVDVKAMDFILGYKDKILDLSRMVRSNVPMDKVGLLTQKNVPDDMVILTGASDIDRLSYFVQYNDKSSLDMYSDASCRSLEGSDGSIFPPRRVHAMQPVHAYKAEACRLIKFVFKEKAFAQGVPAHRYIIDRSTFMSPRTVPDNLCYCNQTDLSECAPDGLFDTSPCSYDAPTLISYPHFYLTDPRASEPFEGLNPNPEQHDMSADIHPRLGMTLQGRSRLQLNVRVKMALPHVRKGLVLPVAWFAQDLPPYEGGFKAMLIVATYGLDALEFVLLYVLPVVAVVTALAFIIALRERREHAAEAADHNLHKDAVSCYT